MRRTLFTGVKFFRSASREAGSARDFSADADFAGPRQGLSFAEVGRRLAKSHRRFLRVANWDRPELG